IRDFHVTGVQTCALPIYGCSLPVFLAVFLRSVGASDSTIRPPAFYVLGIKISTSVDAFIPLIGNAVSMRFRPEGPRIAVPNWLIEWSKSRDLFLTLAHDPWVFRPN